MSTSESSVALLSSVIKQLSISDDTKQRKVEKEKLQSDLKITDEKLTELVETNQEHLKKTVQSFGSVVTRIKTSRQRVSALHEKLALCRKLLYCNREDLKTHWLEGLECSEKLNLLDKIEKAVAVPNQLERYINRKHFLHAADLLSETIQNLDGQLSNVEALRDLKASLHSRRSILYEAIVEEINKQVHADTYASFKKNASETNVAIFKRTFSYKQVTMKSLKGDEIPVFSLYELEEDLQMDPEENRPLLINLLVRSLSSLGKVGEAVEMIKERVNGDMKTVLKKASDAVARMAVENGEVLTIDELASRDDPSILIELLNVAFEKFRSVAWNHSILLAALEQVPECKDANLYTTEDIWSKIQSAIKDMLYPYLEISDNSSTPQQSYMSYGSALESTVSSFFTAKKRLPITSTTTKPRSEQLFKFECSSSSEAILSYMRDKDIASSAEDTYSGFVVYSVPQLLCKSQADNITTIFIPVMEFIKEIDTKTNSTLGSTGVLQHFITDFVEKAFLDQLQYRVSEKEAATTKGHDTLRNICDLNTQKSLKLPRPLLKGSIVVDEIMRELLELMQQLPNYACQILQIIIRTLSIYYESCMQEYKGVVYQEAEGTKIISVNWVRDEDICRLMMSLPNWINLHDGVSHHEEEEDFETTKKLQDREAALLISNLEKVEIERNQVILDIQKLKSLANLQESLEWLSTRIDFFLTGVTAKSTAITIQDAEGMPREIHIENNSLNAIKDLNAKFKELSESTLLLLHLEVRCHCFFFVGKATRESSFVCNADSIEVDPQIPQLVKDLRDLEDVFSGALSPAKLRYSFDGLGYLLAAIMIASTSYIKKINRNGVKKMCQNIFTIQQELANITTRRDLNLDVARQYFEMLYMTPDAILNSILEQGAMFKEQDYSNALELLSRSEVPFDKNLWIVRRNKLSEILKQAELKM